jgi:hypothetical protein
MTNTEAWLNALDQAKQAIEAAAGYKQKAIDAGFSEEAAEQLAVDFHRTVMAHSMPR